MRFATAILLVATLAACDRQTPQEKAHEDERAIAMVEKAQRRIPPPVALNPAQISFADVQASGLVGAGCAFTPKSGEGRDPVLYTDDRRALVKLDGRLVQLAADSGSAEMPYATRDHYVGKAFDLRLRQDPGEGEPASEESMRWSGALTIRDSRKREVYSQPGTLECGA